MTFALIVVGIMVSPVLLGPIVPLLWRREEERLLRVLRKAGDGAFRNGKIGFRKQFDFLSPCDRPLTVCCSPRVCGGQLVDIDEIFMARIKEADREERAIEACIRIGFVCLRCGHLEKTSDSHLLGIRYDHIRTAHQLAHQLNDRMSLVRMGVPI